MSGWKQKSACETKELEKAHGALFEQEKMATFGNLADSVAHELRNPLGVISNAVYYLKLILQEPDPK
jgi:signal transduction histidine kinase